MDIAPLHTLPELLAWRVGHTPRAEAYREFSAAADRWVSLSWADTGERVARWRGALDRLALPRQSRVAILLPNGVDAVCIDQASLAAAMVPVPLHAIDSPGSIAYILSDSEAAVLVLASLAQWQAIAGAGEPLPGLRLVLIAGAEGDALPAQPAGGGGPAVIGVKAWLEQAAPASMPGSAPAPDAGPAADDLAAIVYTSGTTGKPKGVMLTHRNVMANLKSVLAVISPVQSDVFLSFLPLSHTFERTGGYYLAIAAGSCVAFVRSVAQIAEDLKAVRPTILNSVPRIYERFYAKMQESLAAASPAKRALFSLAQRVGWARFCRAQGLPAPQDAPGPLAMLAWPLLKALVADKILALLGGRIRIAVSGGAPLSEAVAQCFIGLGLPLLQGYGMTESSPVVSVNLPDDNWPQTVGRPLPGVQTRIGENRELQVRGDNVMKGYWNRPEDTRKAMTEDGWLRTGDQASLDGGRVRILGRIKEIIVTSTGEKIAPADLELAITSDPLFDQAFVIGDNRKFIAAFVVLNPAHARALGGGEPPQDEEALNHGPLRELALAHVKEACKRFPHYAVPRAVWCSLTPWTIENTMMTPTLKLKRNNLTAHYAARIEAIYGKG